MRHGDAPVMGVVLHCDRKPVMGKGVNTMTALSFEELRSEQVELLPSRETLAFFNWANVSATNLAIAQNTVTLLSLAAASANQAVVVTQL
jgi:hypothetical protein